MKIRKKVGDQAKGIVDPVRTSVPRSDSGCNFPGIEPIRAGDAENTGETGSVRKFTELAPASHRKN